jgi:hypothetical protein
MHIAGLQEWRTYHICTCLRSLFSLSSCFSEVRMRGRNETRARFSGAHCSSSSSVGYGRISRHMHPADRLRQHTAQYRPADTMKLCAWLWPGPAPCLLANNSRAMRWHAMERCAPDSAARRRTLVRGEVTWKTHAPGCFLRSGRGNLPRHA